MGCWNGTCMISNLPIISGEEIKLVILQDGYDKSILGQSGYVYSAGLLSPAFFPITGQYNDYGGIENIKLDWNYQIIEESLKEELGSTLELDGEVTDSWTLEDLLEGIERGNPKYKKGENLIDIKLSTVMIRKDVWDICVSMQKSNNDYWNPLKISDSDPYYITGYHWTKGEFEKFTNAARASNSDPETLGLEQKIESRRFDFMDSIFDGRGDGYKSMIARFKYKNFAKINVDNKEIIQSIEQYWSEQKMVEGCLSSLRKGWMIQPGAGSQDCGWDMYLQFNESISTICQRKLIEE